MRNNNKGHKHRPTQSEQANSAAGGHITGCLATGVQLVVRPCTATGQIIHSGSAVLLVCSTIATFFFWHRQSCHVCTQSLWLNAGMAADPLLHVVVKLQGTDQLLCYTKAATSAAHVFKVCKRRAKCQEGGLQNASVMDLVLNF